MASDQQKTPAQIALELQHAVQREQAELEAREARLQKERGELEAERERMKKIDAKGTDLIHLNVGGRPFSTTRSTLCLECDTVLAAMFSGRWEDRVVRDEKGRAFLNFNPDLFTILLDYLRSKELAPPETHVSLPPPSELPPLQRTAYAVMLNYLGFGPASGGVGGDGKFTFVANDKFTITNAGKTAKHTFSQNQWWHIVTEQKCIPGVSVWRVRTGVAGVGAHNMMLGIVMDNFTPKQNLYNTDGYVFSGAVPHTYGREGCHMLTSGRAFEPGHTVALSLSTGGVLTLNNETTGVTHTLHCPVQMTDTYKFVFHAYCGNEAEILDA